MPPPLDTDLVDAIDALLPQTQCQRCGERGCRPYAAAIARGDAPIDRCPPGGESTIAALARLLDVPPLPPDTTRGRQQPLALAFIEEATCIGCTLCIHACPTDAIVGAKGRMHTVVAERCTGCELCVPPCPVDCIVMRPAHRSWSVEDAQRARVQHAVRNQRLADQVRARRDARASASGTRAQRRSAIAAALARARARRAPVR